jgi:hypothetical protein
MPWFLNLFFKKYGQGFKNLGKIFSSQFQNVGSHTFQRWFHIPVFKNNLISNV